MTKVQIKQTIGQLEASIDKIEPLVNQEDFAVYCDAIQTAIVAWRCKLKEIRNPDNI
jgi:hypothetical protein